MKTAKLVVDSVCVLCPECNEAIPNRANGSLLWCREDFHEKSREVQCPSCDKQVRVLKRKTVVFE